MTLGDLMNMMERVEDLKQDIAECTRRANNPQTHPDNQAMALIQKQQATRILEEFLELPIWGPR